MKRVLVVVLAGLVAAGVVGCQSGGKQAAKTEQAAPAPVMTTYRPSDWAKGTVFEVWPYGKGELAAWLGARDGLQKGDILILARDGTQINAVEVLNVSEDICYGRVFDRSDEALLPKVGDMVIRGPQPLMPPTDAPAQK